MADMGWWGSNTAKQVHLSKKGLTYYPTGLSSRQGAWEGSDRLGQSRATRPAGAAWAQTWRAGAGDDCDCRGLEMSSRCRRIAEE